LAIVCTGAIVVALAAGGTLRIMKSRSTVLRQPSILAAAEEGRHAADEPLTNEGIARMGRAQISPAVLKRLIRAQPHHFRIDAEALVALKKSGVPDEVILEWWK
jgi:hypothetical protein